MLEVMSKDRVQMRKSLSEKEIIESHNKQLETIQFSDEVDVETFDRLNELLFSVRDDVNLRVFGFYDTTCDLSFLTRLPSLKRFSVDTHSMSDHLEAITALPHLVSLGIEQLELDSFSILTKVSPTIEHLFLGPTFSKKPDLAVIERFHKLKTLYIEGQAKNIEVIGKLTALEDITLRSVTTADVDFLKPLTKLWSLDVKLGGIKSFNALEGMNNLKYLELWQIRGLSDLSFISTIFGLQYLFLQSLSNVDSLPSLLHLTKLRKVALEI